MEAFGDQDEPVTIFKMRVSVPWLYTLHTVWMKWVQAVFMQCSPYTCSWNTETCRSAPASSGATLYRFKTVFLFLHMLLTCSFRWNKRTGKRITIKQCIEHLGKHHTVRNSTHRKPSMVFFHSSSSTNIAEALNVQHINTFGTCDDELHFAQHSYASYSGAVRREGRTILGAKSKLLYCEIALSRKSFGIGHMYCTYIHFCLE